MSASRSVRYGDAALATIAAIVIFLSGLWGATLAAPGPTNFDVLGLYDRANEPRADQSRLHRLLELPLNHLG
jgi:hypothetical protein